MARCQSSIDEAYCTLEKFMFTNQSAKTTKLFHRERFAIYGIYGPLDEQQLLCHVRMCVCVFVCACDYKH